MKHPKIPWDYDLDKSFLLHLNYLVLSALQIEIARFAAPILLSGGLQRVYLSTIPLAISLFSGVTEPRSLLAICLNIFPNGSLDACSSHDVLKGETR